MKSKFLIVVGGLLIAACAVVFRALSVNNVKDDKSGTVGEKNDAAQSKYIKEVKPAEKKAAPSVKKRSKRRLALRTASDDGIYRDSEGRAYSDSDQKLFAMLDEAFEKDDLATIKRLSGEIATSSNRDLREKAVEALGWFGEKAIIELTGFLSDKDNEIAGLARTEWVSGLQQIDADKDKCAVIEVALCNLRDKSMLEEVSNELVGTDELAAIKVIANVMNENSYAAPYIKEAYQTITGEKWTGIEAAEAWLQENYEPDED